MKPILIILCALPCVPTRAVSAADSDADRSPSRGGVLTLSVVTQAVLTANPSVREARARASALAQRPAQVSAWEDPKLAVSSRVARFVSIAPNSFTDQQVGIEQSIPISGRNQIRARISSEEVIIANEEVRRRELDSVAKARSAYFRLARDNALLELNHSNERSWRETIESTRARFEVGTRSQADVLAAESELARIAEARRDLERALSEDQTELNLMMGRAPSTPLGRPVDVRLEDRGHFLRDAQLQSVAVSRRPEVLIAGARMNAAGTQRKLARRSWVPDPTLGVTAQRYNSASQVVSEVGAGVSITLPWVNPGKYRALEQEAADADVAAQRALDLARLEALGRLRDQLARVETNQHHVELFRDRLVPLARQTLDATRTDYTSGRSVFADLLLAQRNLFDTESTYRHHIADLQMALAELEAVVGVDLHVFPAARPTTRR